MKIIITESQFNLLTENVLMSQQLRSMIKKVGWESANKLVGGSKNLMKILKIDTPMDLLNLFFNDMDVVQSKERPEWTLFRYNPYYNLMVYNRKKEIVYVSYKDIWLVLEDNFGLNYSDVQELMKVWLGEVYNLRGVTPTNLKLGDTFHRMSVTI